MAAKARARCVGYETERFGGGGLNDFVDVDSHAVGDYFHFIDQANIDRPVDVFQQFGHFGGAGGADGHEALDGFFVEGGAEFKALWRHAADNFGNLRGGEVRVARVFTFGRVDQRAVQPGGKTALCEPGREQFVGGARPGGALQAHQLPRPEVGQYGVDGIGDVAEVGLMVAVQRGRDADDLGVDLAGQSKVAGGGESCGFGTMDFAGRYALDIALTAVETGDLGWVDIKADDPDADLGKAQRQWQADVAQPVDANHALA